MPSWYDDNPGAFEDALARSAFEARLLDGTGLKDFLACDPENAAQDRARSDLRTILERAWDAALDAQRRAHEQGAVIHA